MFHLVVRLCPQCCPPAPCGISAGRAYSRGMNSWVCRASNSNIQRSCPTTKCRTLQGMRFILGFCFLKRVTTPILFTMESIQLFCCLNLGASYFSYSDLFVAEVPEHCDCCTAAGIDLLADLPLISGRYGNGWRAIFSWQALSRATDFESRLEWFWLHAKCAIIPKYTARI